MGPGTLENAGGVVSVTLTLNSVAVEGWPEASLAVQETWVAPSLKVLPVSGVQVTVGDGSTASLAVGRVKETTAPLALVASADTSACPDRVGGVVSVTLTLNSVAAEVRPEASLAVQETWVAPSLKVLPE